MNAVRDNPRSYKRDNTPDGVRYAYDGEMNLHAGIQNNTSLL